MPMGNFTQYTVFENHSKCLIWILAFFASFCPIKIDLSGNIFWVRWVPRNPRFPYVQFKIFEARFARFFNLLCIANLQIFQDYFMLLGKLFLLGSWKRNESNFCEEGWQNHEKSTAKQKFQKQHLLQKQKCTTHYGKIDIFV